MTDALEDHQGTVSIGGFITNLRFADDDDDDDTFIKVSKL